MDNLLRWEQFRAVPKEAQKSIGGVIFPQSAFVIRLKGVHKSIHILLRYDPFAWRHQLCCIYSVNLCRDYALNHEVSDHNLQVPLNKRIWKLHNLQTQKYLYYIAISSILFKTSHNFRIKIYNSIAVLCFKPCSNFTIN